MKTLNTQEFLKHYKIDVEFIDLEDTFELEDLFFKRREIVKRFNSLTLDEIVEFFKLEKELANYLPEIKRRYKLFYDKVIKPTNYELQEKLKFIKEKIPSTISV